MSMVNRIITLIVFVLVCGKISAQQNRSYSERIRTLEVVVNGDRQQPPVISLSGDDKIAVQFDDMTHDYVRYLYKLEHCDRDWKVSDSMFESDYMVGTNLDRPIDNYEQSTNTMNLYTHYVLEFPNSYVQPRLSGNYKVTIYDEEDLDNPVAEAFFSIVDNKMGILASASTNTDIDKNDSHQQIDLTINFGNVELRDPSREVYVRVVQNKRYDNSVENPEATFVSNNEMRWQHCRDLIFPAGNEFRKFEILNIHQPTLGVEKMRWFAPYYHAFLYPGNAFKNYIFTEEINGAYVVRNEDNDENDINSEYVIVHFTLNADEMRDDGSFYVCGQWNSYNFIPEYRMRYNSDAGAYEASVLLKQGYYNYTYLFVKDKAHVGSMAESEGNFFQTENEYTVYVYAHLQGERYDRLLGYRDFRFIPNK